MDKSLIQRFAPFRSSFALAKFICFSFLAITTGVMVYNAFQGPINRSLSPGMAGVALFGLVGGIFFLVDYGLAGRLSATLRNYDGLQVADKNYSAQKSLLGVIVVFLVLRLMATGLSSIWAGGEISDNLNKENVTDQYIDAALANDESQDLRITTAQAEADRLTGSEASRIEQATQKGDEEIARAIASGNPQQREMYRTNPAFFDNLNPNSQWTRGNERYIGRIRAAEANKEAYIRTERNATATAQALLYSTTADTTAGQFAAAMGISAVSAQNNLDLRRSRHRSMIIAFDWFCLFFGLLSVYLIHKIDVVTDRKPEERSFSYILSKYVDRKTAHFWDWLETALGVDLDGNGRIGSQQTLQLAAAANTGKKSNTNTPQNRRRIAFKQEETSGTDNGYDESLASPSKDYQAQTRKMLIQTHLGAYKNLKSQYHAWQGEERKGKRQSTKDNAVRQQYEKLGAMQFHIDRLNELGYQLPDSMLV